MEDSKGYIVQANTSLIDVMKKINDKYGNALYVDDGFGHLIGSITDGDVRRWIINGGRLEATAADFMFKTPHFVLEDDKYKANKIMRMYGIQSLPIVAEDMRIIGVILNNTQGDANDLSNEVLRDIPVIIMAGGMGTRLLPLTRVLPKPLMPICGVPIVERVINGFNEFGIHKFYLTVNYKKNVIESYFSETERTYSIKFIEENVPLGTAGGISLIKDKFESPIIISNCDVLVETNFNDLIKFHIDSRNDMTIISSIKSVPIPYGVLNISEEGRVVSIEEKPTYSRLINTGIYVLNPEIIEWIPKDQKYHMTDLTKEMIRGGRKVGTFPVGEGAFYDMGEYEEMQRMEEHLKNAR